MTMNEILQYLIVQYTDDYEWGITNNHQVLEYLQYLHSFFYLFIP